VRLYILDYEQFDIFPKAPKQSLHGCSGGESFPRSLTGWDGPTKNSQHGLIISNRCTMTPASIENADETGLTTVPALVIPLKNGADMRNFRAEYLPNTTTSRRDMSG
jgi:hypothetical protein